MVFNVGEYMYMCIAIHDHRRQKNVQNPGIAIYGILTIRDSKASTTLVRIHIGENFGHSHT